MFDREAETLPRDDLRRLQDERLRSIVAYAYERVPLYRERLDAAGVRPGDVRSVGDLAKLPFTRKQDLRDHYPFGMLAVPREQLVRVHASSGTTGKPTVVCYTRGDIDLFAAVNARSMAAAGARPGMLLHNAYGYGLFTGGLGLHYGGERLGLVVVPVSGGVTERQITLIRDFEPEVIACTPSYAQTLAGEFARRGIDPDAISLKYAVLGAEPWTEAIREHVQQGLGVTACNIYGLSEVIGPGVSQECIEERAGSHIWEDHFLPEIVDPSTGESLPEGSEGELVFTTLTREAMPVLRYRTGDLTYLSYEPCSCGRSHVRMGPIRGRTDDMLIVRGVNIYPTQIEEILAGIADVVPHYQLVVSRDGTLDEVEVRVEVTEPLFARVGQDVLSDEIVETNQRLRVLRESIARRIRDTLGLRTTVTLVAPGTVPRSEGGKLRRVVDNRRL
ncbi:MAG TPA: phenylacetate--CoA ligase [Thermomicrobiaceae bacterium]|nr:phenylacetate--CoA ligase [Thermomicrobiaceae bacterium]